MNGEWEIEVMRSKFATVPDAPLKLHLGSAKRQEAQTSGGVSKVR
jgi:hypothetical protein